MNEFIKPQPPKTINPRTKKLRVAGAYFLYGKDGAKNRKKIRSWSLKMKADVMDQIEKLKDVTEESYSMVIDQVAEKYSKVKNIDLSELDALIK